MGAGMLELAEKARVGQWSADEAIDWSEQVRRPKWMSRALCGQAIGLLQDLSAYLSCPLFRRIMRKLTVDEARHLAFGKNFLSENLQNLSPEEKRDAYNWVKDLWIDGAVAASIMGILEYLCGEAFTTASGSGSVLSCGPTPRRPLHDHDPARGLGVLSLLLKWHFVF